MRAHAKGKKSATPRATSRQSEERFAGLIDGLTDFYWEQDEHCRFTLIKGGQVEKSGIDPSKYLGKAPWDQGGILLGNGGSWDAYKAVVEARQPFSDVLLKYVGPRGEARCISTSGLPVFDGGGRFQGYRGIARDVTKERRSELLLRLEHTVNRSLAEADRVSDALRAAIRAVCESEGWDCGRYLRVDEAAGLLRVSETWGVSNPAIERFLAGSREVTYTPGQGLAGLVWQSGQPIWVADINADPRTRQKHVTREIGLRGGIFFPVLSEGKTIGVLAFNSREFREPDERLLQAVQVIGSQIGQYVQRKIAEEALRESETHFRALSELSADWYWEQDARFRIVSVSRDLGEGSRSSIDEWIGRTFWEMPYLGMTEERWREHRLLLVARHPFQDLVMGRPLEDGGVQHISCSGYPFFDGTGEFRGYRGVARDITATRRGEQLVALEHAVNRALAEAVSVSDALKAVIRAVCESEGWECGRYWRIDEKAHVLRFGEAWGVDSAPIRQFLERSRDLAFAPNVGMAGTVWVSGEPLWVADVTCDARVTQRALSREFGIHGAFVVPVTADGKTTSVLGFSSHSVRKPDDRLLQAMRVIGSQIGQFVQRKHAEEEQRRFRAAMDASADLMLLIDPVNFRYVDVNDAACRALGYGREELLALGPQDIFSRTREELAQLYERMISGELSTPTVNGIYRRKDGSLLPVEAHPRAMRSADGHVIVSIARDITERLAAEEALRASEARFRSLTELSSDLYWEQDEQFRFTSFAGTGSNRIKLGTSKAIGKTRWEHGYINMSQEDWAAHIATLEAHQPFHDLELCRVDESGEKVWVSVSGEPVFDSAGTFKGYRGVGKDITERKRDEERIRHLASHDSLTALPNRVMFSEVLNFALQSAHRYEGHFAVLFLDLDRFKVINDTLGHEAGDKLLQEIGRRLTETVRKSDVVARLGGDEFVILVQQVSEPKQVEAVARKILSAVMKPTVIHGQECRVTASVGICMYPSDAADEQSLMKHADIAMYRAKEGGKNTFMFYSEETNVHSFERLALEASLRRGLERNEFFLHYQAKIDLNTQQITGVEALVRWRHPDMGIVPPAQFIPIAEETGLIVPIGRWVLNAACAQNVAWQRQGLPPLRISVNLSARQFSDDGLIQDVEEALAQSGLKAELLELELTESTVMQNYERAGKVLEAIKKMGVRLAIDDFGVGYSSLTHLKHFPIDTLKVDRSFIRDIPQDPEDRAITEAIIAMGKSLKLTVVAEGVETLEQQSFLHARACDEAQGYLFSKPVASEQFAELLKQRIAASQT